MGSSGACSLPIRSPPTSSSGGRTACHATSHPIRPERWAPATASPHTRSTPLAQWRDRSTWRCCCGPDSPRRRSRRACIASWRTSSVTRWGFSRTAPPPPTSCSTRRGRRFPRTATATRCRSCITRPRQSRRRRASLTASPQERPSLASRRQEALDYHAQGRPGKIEVTPTKPFKDQRDLSLAYTPGVAEPCLEIAKRPEDAYLYTAKGNLVAVVTNGTAVLGLGNIGALAGKPVMEGKGILFKAFADIDVFDLEVGSEKPEDVIRFCQLLEPTVGGINLEDIRSPDCFYIEQQLRDTLGIPVFHDDQHGTAIISGAALLNALVLVKKDIAQIKIVFAGAGAASIATAEHYVRLGALRENIVMCDHKGVIYQGREGLDEFKQRFARDTKART